MFIRYKKLRPSAKTPIRAHPSDAGLDVFYCSKDNDEFKTGMSLLPGENAKLGTGLAFEVPHGYALLVKNKGGVAFKRRLDKGAEVIDSGYTGEIFIDLHNIGTERQVIVDGEKIAQLIMVPVIHFQPLEVEEIYDHPVTISDRGEGALGSTGV